MQNSPPAAGLRSRQILHCRNAIHSGVFNVIGNAIFYYVKKSHPIQRVRFLSATIYPKNIRARTYFFKNFCSPLRYIRISTIAAGMINNMITVPIHPSNTDDKIKIISATTVKPMISAPQN